VEAQREKKKDVLIKKKKKTRWDKGVRGYYNDVTRSRKSRQISGEPVGEGAKIGRPSVIHTTDHFYLVRRNKGSRTPLAIEGLISRNFY